MITRDDILESLPFLDARDVTVSIRSLGRQSQAAKVFDSLIEGKFQWHTSGIQWTDDNIIEIIYNLGEGVVPSYYFSLFAKMIQKHDENLSEILYIFFSGHNDILVQSKKKLVGKVIEYCESRDDEYITEYWVYDPVTEIMLEGFFYRQVVIGRSVAWDLG